MTPTFLTPSQIESFFQNGYIHLTRAIEPKLAEQCALGMLDHMDINEHDPESWRELYKRPGNRAEPPRGKKEVIRYSYAEYAPRLWAAMCDLLGGAERIIPDKCFRDNGVYKLADPDVLALPDPSVRWSAPLPGTTHAGWHIDGAPSWFDHYLDSREVALLVILLYRDSTKLGGATWIAPESPALVARYFADHPVGKCPNNQEILQQCSDYRCAEGRAGDAFLLHPFMMHTASTNVLRAPRLMENDNISLRENMCFDRPDPQDYSVVERSILRYLRVDRLAFTRQPKARVT